MSSIYLTSAKFDVLSQSAAFLSQYAACRIWSRWTDSGVTVIGRKAIIRSIRQQTEKLS